MKQKYFDFVTDDLIENNSIEVLEYIFLKLNINLVYVLKEIKKKEDFNDGFLLPKTSSKIVFKKAYLLKDPALFHLYKEKEIVLVESKSLKNNTYISTNKKMNFLKDPISDKLCFDEQNARSCKQNNTKVFFDINLFRSKTLKHQYLKQAIFIIMLLKRHNVDMVFSSFAKTIDDLVDVKLILFNFLKNFNLEESTINRFLSKDILKTEKT
jgi:hypothetical protein